MAAAQREHHAASPISTIGFAGRYAVALTLCGAVLTAAVPSRAVTCTSPDVLCKGNPCVTSVVRVSSPCVLDFGTRTLVIGGKMRVPNGGVLSLRAGGIEVRHSILGRHAYAPAGDGANITLTATGNILVDQRIDASAHDTAGSIHLTAGGNVSLLAPLRARTNPLKPLAPGGEITIDAGGTISAVLRARLRAQGTHATPGGSIHLTSGRGVQLAGRVAADGSTGGTIDIYSAAGNISLEGPVFAGGMTGDGGGAVIVAASGGVTTFAPIDTAGLGHGGHITILGALPVSANSTLRADSSKGQRDGGDVVLASNADIAVRGAVSATGMNGGGITVVSQAGTARVTAPIDAGGNGGIGGAVLMTGGQALAFDGTAIADGNAQGGSIIIAADSISASPRSALFARGRSGGTIDIRGAMVTIPAGARMAVDGTAPAGTITLAATGGNLVLTGDFSARGRTGGRIEGTASGDLLASGAFAARGDGCIGFSAGATVDISGGAFDVPVVDHCP
jgi:hypothetical protein